MGFETVALLWQRHGMIKKLNFPGSFGQVASKLGILLFIACSAPAIAAPVTGEVGQTNMENPFEQAYWGVELTSNTPVGKTAERLGSGGGSGDVQPMIAYRYRLSTGWMLGVNGGFKGLKRGSAESTDSKDSGDSKVNSKDLAVLAFGYESLKGWRLYHPFYFFAGGKFQYLLPAAEAVLPIHRDDEFRSEFGCAVSAMLAFKPAGPWLMTARIDRWRGLTTTQLQGYETAIGLLVSL